jgi:hypothetical protein
MLRMWVSGTSGHFSGISVTGVSYFDMLSQLVIPELDNVGLPNSAILQQDAAPAHYAADLHAFLNNKFSL